VISVRNAPKERGGVRFHHGQLVEGLPIVGVRSRCRESSL
jgi:hypothetical protein